MSSALEKLYAICDPMEALTTEQDLAMAVERDDVDPTFRASQKIVKHLTKPHGSQAKILLYGSRGCGKTTELHRIKTQLREDFLVVGLDLSQNQVQLDELTVEELVLLVGIAITRSAKAVWNLDFGEEIKTMVKAIAPLKADSKQSDGIQISIPKMLEAVVLFGTGFTGTGAVVDLARLTFDAASWDFSLGGVLRKTGDRRPGTELLDGVNGIIGRIRKEGTRPPLVIVDQFDKIKSPTTSRDVLTRHDLLRGIDCPIIVASPNNLVYSTLAGGYKTYCLYPISAWQYKNPDQIDPNGHRKLEEIILHRARAAGDEDLISPQALRLLVNNSGGSIRDLIRLARLAVEWALEEREDVTIKLEDADRAVKQLRRTYQLRPLDENSIRCLQQTIVDWNLPDNQLARELLNDNLVLRYSNGEPWYYPHSVLLPYLSSRNRR